MTRRTSAKELTPLAIKSTDKANVTKHTHFFRQNQPYSKLNFSSGCFVNKIISSLPATTS